MSNFLSFWSIILCPNLNTPPPRQPPDPMVLHKSGCIKNAMSLNWGRRQRHEKGHPHTNGQILTHFQIVGPKSSWK